jgi:hypothetical protein
VHFGDTFQWGIRGTSNRCALHPFDGNVDWYHWRLQWVDLWLNGIMLNSYEIWRNQILFWLKYIRHDGQSIIRELLYHYLGMIPSIPKF